MRIGLVAPYDWSVPGGVRRHIAALDRAFGAAGHEVSILAAVSDGGARGPEVPANLIPVGSRVVPVPAGGSRARAALSPRLSGRLKTVLAERRFDVIHLHEPLMPAVCLLTLVHARAHRPVLVVGTFHACRDRFTVYECGRPVVRRLMARLDGRVAVSEAARRTIGRYFPGDYRLIPNGVDLDLFGRDDPGPRPGRSAPSVLFVGRLEKRKGLAWLLRAFERVCAQVPGTRLVVAGAYSREQAAPFEREGRARGLGVHFAGRLPDDDLARLYCAADVVCVPSLGSESFGLVLLEAMAAGRPVVATDIPGYREVVRDGIEGLLVPPASEAPLAEALVRVLTDPPLAVRLGQAGRLRARAFAWDRVAAQVLDYYSELLERRG